MTMKNDAKTDMRNLTNFGPTTQKSEKFALYWAAFDQSKLKKYRGVMFDGTED